MECTRFARAFGFLLLVSGILCAQEYSFRTFGNAEGLNNLAVRQVYQDRGGFIWVSTENGLFRYDGDRFEAFGPAQGIPIILRGRVWRSSGRFPSAGGALGSITCWAIVLKNLKSASTPSAHHKASSQTGRGTPSSAPIQV